MNESLRIMQRLLRPVTPDEIASVVRARTGSASTEQLTLSDADLEDEVRELLNRGADLEAGK